MSPKKKKKRMAAATQTDKVKKPRYSGSVTDSGYGLGCDYTGACYGGYRGGYFGDYTGGHYGGNIGGYHGGYTGDFCGGNTGGFTGEQEKHCWKMN